jgi:hypothetical protein
MSSRAPTATRPPPSPRDPSPCTETQGRCFISTNGAVLDAFLPPASLPAGTNSKRLGRRERLALCPCFRGTSERLPHGLTRLAWDEREESGGAGCAPVLACHCSRAGRTDGALDSSVAGVSSGQWKRSLIKEAAALRPGSIIVATLLIVPVLLLHGSDVGEPWRTVADVADWLSWLMLAAQGR